MSVHNILCSRVLPLGPSEKGNASCDAESER